MIAKLTALKNHAGFMRYFKNTSWMMAEQFLRILAGLFVGIWVARYLGPEQFGLFSYVLAFTAIFGGIAKLGLDGIMVRELVNHPENRDVYLGTAFWLKVIGAFIVMGLMAAIVPFTSNDATTNTFIFIIAAGMVFQSFEVVQFYFQSQVLAKIISICKAIQLALSSIIKVYLVLTESELIWFVLVTVFDALSLAFSYFIAYQLRKNPAFYKYFDFNIAKNLLKDSWPFMISIIVFSIYLQMDVIMIKEMLGTYEVGLYAAGLKVAMAHIFLSSIITLSLFPAILNAKKVSLELYHHRIGRLFSLLFLINITVVVVLTFLAGSLLKVLYGDEFAPASTVMIVQVWSSIFAAMGFVFHQILMAENLGSVALFRAVVGLFINLSLNLILIPIYGILGAAIALLVAQITSNYLFDVLDKKIRLFFFIKTKSFFLHSFFTKKQH
jgi:O-antigen/teichoic acid export membrane protein